MPIDKVEELSRLRQRNAELEQQLERAERCTATLRQILVLPVSLADRVTAAGSVGDEDLARWLAALPEAVAAVPPLLPRQLSRTEQAGAELAALAGQRRCPHCGFINSAVRTHCRHCSRALSEALPS